MTHASEKRHATIVNQLSIAANFTNKPAVREKVARTPFIGQGFDCIPRLGALAGSGPVRILWLSCRCPSWCQLVPHPGGTAPLTPLLLMSKCCMPEKPAASTQSAQIPKGESDKSLCQVKSWLVPVTVAFESGRASICAIQITAADTGYDANRP